MLLVCKFKTQQKTSIIKVLYLKTKDADYIIKCKQFNIDDKIYGLENKYIYKSMSEVVGKIKDVINIHNISKHNINVIFSAKESKIFKYNVNAVIRQKYNSFINSIISYITKTIEIKPDKTKLPKKLYKKMDKYREPLNPKMVDDILDDHKLLKKVSKIVPPPEIKKEFKTIIYPEKMEVTKVPKEEIKVVEQVVIQPSTEQVVIQPTKVVEQVVTQPTKIPEKKHTTRHNVPAISPYIRKSRK